MPVHGILYLAQPYPGMYCHKFCPSPRPLNAALIADASLGAYCALKRRHLPPLKTYIRHCPQYLSTRIAPLNVEQSVTSEAVAMSSPNSSQTLPAHDDKVGSDSPTASTNAIEENGESDPQLSKRIQLVMYTICLLTLMIALDGTTIGVALPVSPHSQTLPEVRSSRKFSSIEHNPRAKRNYAGGILVRYFISVMLHRYCSGPTCWQTRCLTNLSLPTEHRRSVRDIRSPRAIPHIHRVLFRWRRGGLCGKEPH